MKPVFAVIAWLMVAEVLTKDDGYPHPPAPEWVTTDDRGLNRLFAKKVGDHLGRVQWIDIGYSRSEGAPLQTMRNGALAVSVGRKIAPRVTLACVADFSLQADDPKHWFPEDPRHWEKYLGTQACVVVEPPSDAGGVAKFPDLIRRVYGVPIVLVGRMSPREVVEVLDFFWRELLKQCAAPEKYRIPDCLHPVWLNDDGAPMWECVAGIRLTNENSRRVATIQLMIGMFDDTEGFSCMLRRTARGWQPTDEMSEMVAPFDKSD